MIPVQGIIALVACALMAGLYWLGRVDGRALERGEQKRQAEIVRDVRDAALSGAAEAINKIEVKHVTVRQALEREIVERPVYRDCRHTPDGLRILNQALEPPEGRPPGEGVVSAPGAPPG